MCRVEAGQLSVFYRYQVWAGGLAGGHHAQQLLIAHVRAILKPHPSGTKRGDRDAKPDMSRSVGPVDDETILATIGAVPKAQVFDASEATG